MNKLKSIKMKVGQKNADSRVPKPPKPPEKPLMPYMRYSRKVWESVKNSNPHLKLWEVGKIIGQMWRELPENEKSHFVEEYENDKIQYNDALRLYHNSPAYKSWLSHKERVEKSMDDTESIDSSYPSQCNKQKDRFQKESHMVETRESYILEDNDEDPDEVFTVKHIAAQRYQRNQKLMLELYSDYKLPELGTMVTEARLNALYQQVEGLMAHKRKLEEEIEEYQKLHENKKTKIRNESEKFWTEYKKELDARPVITEKMFTEMVKKARDDIIREEKEREMYKSILINSQDSKTNQTKQYDSNKIPRTAVEQYLKPSGDAVLPGLQSTVTNDTNKAIMGPQTVSNINQRILKQDVQKNFGIQKNLVDFTASDQGSEMDTSSKLQNKTVSNDQNSIKPSSDGTIAEAIASTNFFDPSSCSNILSNASATIAVTAPTLTRYSTENLDQSQHISSINTTPISSQLGISAMATSANVTSTPITTTINTNKKGATSVNTNSTINSSTTSSTSAIGSSKKQHRGSSSNNASSGIPPVSGATATVNKHSGTSTHSGSSSTTSSSSGHKTTTTPPMAAAAAAQAAVAAATAAAGGATKSSSSNSVELESVSSGGQRTPDSIVGTVPSSMQQQQQQQQQQMYSQAQSMGDLVATSAPHGPPMSQQSHQNVFAAYAMQQQQQHMSHHHQQQGMYPPPYHYYHSHPHAAAAAMNSQFMPPRAPPPPYAAAVAAVYNHHLAAAGYYGGQPPPPPPQQMSYRPMAPHHHMPPQQQLGLPPPTSNAAPTPTDPIGQPQQSQHQQQFNPNKPVSVSNAPSGPPLSSSQQPGLLPPPPGATMAGCYPAVSSAAYNPYHQSPYGMPPQPFASTAAAAAAAQQQYMQHQQPHHHHQQQQQPQPQQLPPISQPPSSTVTGPSLMNSNSGPQTHHDQQQPQQQQPSNNPNRQQTPPSNKDTSISSSQSNQMLSEDSAKYSNSSMSINQDVVSTQPSSQSHHQQQQQPIPTSMMNPYSPHQYPGLPYTNQTSGTATHHYPPGPGPVIAPPAHYFYGHPQAAAPAAAAPDYSSYWGPQVYPSNPMPPVIVSTMASTPTPSNMTQMSQTSISESQQQSQQQTQHQQAQSQPPQPSGQQQQSQPQSQQQQQQQQSTPVSSAISSTNNPTSESQTQGKIQE